MAGRVSVLAQADDASTKLSHPSFGSSSGRPQHPDTELPNAFDRRFLETFARREPAPATPEADHTGPWRVTRLHGAGEPQR